MDQKVGEATVGELLPLSIIIVLLFLFLIFCIRSFIITSKAKKLAKAESTKLMSDKNATLIVIAKHVNGLPLPEGTRCKIISCPESYEILANGTTFDLSKKKTTDVCIKTDIEIQQQYVSSIGGAVGGAVLFGPLGAMIGGRAKQKKLRKVSSYLIITYTSDDDVKYVGFDVTETLINARKLVYEAQTSNAPNNVTVEL